MPQSKRIAIIGAGAIGGNVAGPLHLNGFDVTLIDQWPEHVQAVRAHGLKVVRQNDQLVAHVPILHLHEVQAITQQFDYVFVAMKSYDTQWSTILMRPYLAEDGAFVSFQNGVNDETIATLVGAKRTLGAVVTIGGGCYEPGTVLRTDRNPHGFKVGELDGTDTPRAHELAALLEHVALSSVTTNLLGERWSKLMINTMNNGVAGLTGWGTSEVRQIAQPRRVGIQLGAETIRVAKALGYRVEPVLNVDPDDLVAAAEGRNVNAVESAIAEAGNFSVGGRPSLLQDTMKGRRTEIEHLNGLVSRKGREVGIATPFSDRIVEVINGLGVGFEPKPEYLDPLIELLP
jgi:2-dehydropantoate 2-reductase